MALHDPDLEGGPQLKPEHPQLFYIVERSAQSRLQERVVLDHAKQFVPFSIMLPFPMVPYESVCMPAGSFRALLLYSG